jgi:dTMP kinase
MNKKGTFIVFEGGDGVGKTTQAKLLNDYLNSKNIDATYVKFPRYDTFHGKTVAKFLQGEFGNNKQVSPYLATLAYALDREGAKEDIQALLDKGTIVVNDRYATSNLAHQTIKFETPEEQKEFYDWNYELEYVVNGIPKEDIVVLLNVPLKYSNELLKKERDAAYLEGKVDIHETDNEYRKKVEAMYKKMAAENKNWITVDCVEDDKLLSIEQVHQKVIQSLKDKGIL